MRLLIATVALMVLAQSTNEQESSLRERLLQSKGNIRLSTVFNEAPVLPIDDVNVEIYRITFIPTFFKPIKVRIEKRKGQYMIVAKRLSGQGGFDAGTLESEKRRGLKHSEWRHLVSLLAAADFWSMPYLDKEPQPNDKGEVEICLDGSEWVLEGVKEGKFHAVNRYCPADKRFQEIGSYLAKLSGLKIKERELY
jgi:hypothetical protein